MLKNYFLSLLCLGLSILAGWEENPLWRGVYTDFLHHLEKLRRRKNHPAGYRQGTNGL